MINIGSHGTPGHVVAFFPVLVGQYMHIVAEICGCFISGAHEPPKVDRSVYIHCVNCCRMAAMLKTPCMDSVYYSQVGAIQNPYMQFLGVIRLQFCWLDPPLRCS